MDQLDAGARPTGLVAELTHRCPLGCPYCSNPLTLEPRERELDAATWSRLFQEAAALGVRDVHLSGGEPGARRDLVDIAAHAREAGLHTNLITSGVGITTRTLRDLWEAGLEQVSVSYQDADAVVADRIAGHRGAFQRRHALAAEAVRLGLPLTVGVVVHRANIDRIGDMAELALGLRAARFEITSLHDVGWAIENRAALSPTGDQLARSLAEVQMLRRRYAGKLAIDTTNFERGWFTVTPSGRVLPCAADLLPAIEPWTVHDHSLAEIWAESPAFVAFRAGELPRPPADPDGVAAARQPAGYVHRRM